jgi:hypothetical protein
MLCNVIFSKEFLEDFNGISYIPEKHWLSNYDLELYTDSAGGSSKECAAIFARKWVFMQWPAAWKNTPVLRDITYLELIPIALAIYLWGHLLKNKKVIFFCDNEAVVFILNNKAAKSERVMTLFRFAVYWTLKSNIQLKAKTFFHPLIKLQTIFLVGRSNSSEGWRHQQIDVLVESLWSS